MNDLISIIVPIYNVENYVEECIDSLIHQSYKNIEIILVDDCSTDSSYKKCMEKSKTDKRIKAYQNSKNLGVGKTRNRGIGLAKGDWILFVDGDDYIDRNLCEDAINKLHVNVNIDTVHWGYQTFEDGTGKIQESRSPIMGQYQVVLQPEIKNTFMNALTVSYQDLYTWFEKGGVL